MTDGVTAVLDKIKGNADGMANKFTKLQDRIGGSTAKVKHFGAQGKQALQEFGGGAKEELLNLFQNQLPSGIGTTISSMGALAGPLIVVAGLVAGIGMALNKGIDAAEAYGVPFRELRNLNLDKPKAEIDALNDRILKLSFDKGLDPEAMVKGVFDIQSATGQYGPAVEGMVARVGDASRALNMDFATAVAGAGKALVAFKLPMEDVDKLIESNAKTVQVGIVSFDELSKVQTEYAGAAASTNQQLDTANKVFAVLTKSTKSADIAASMAKTAFQDLGKKSTIDGLAKIGVNVFDANKNMRQADDILRDLVPKLGNMSDQTFSKLKEEIGGSEGLRALLDQSKASGAEVLRTFDAFDETPFSIGDAIKNANGDLDVMNNIMDNKVKASWVELGQAVMPMWIKIRGVVNDLILGAIDLGRRLGAVVDWYKEIYNESALIRGEVQVVALTVTTAWNTIVAAFKVSIAFLMAPIKAIGLALTGNFKGAFAALGEGGDKIMAALDTGGQKVIDNFKGAVDATVNGGVDPLKVKVKPVLDPISEKLLAGPVNPFANPLKPAGPKADPMSDPYAKLFGDKDKKDKSTSAGSSGISDGGGRVRNVTINIAKLVERIEVRTSGNVKDGLNSIQAQVEEAIVSMVRGSEATLANG